jgi:DNA-directed RNA polymerase subunit RPC12/RpoP
MATYRRTIITYTCPRCRTDIGRRFGLITSRLIVCPNCSTKVRVDANAVAQNWGFNFAWVGGLLSWLALGAGILADPQFATLMGNGTLPAATLENRLVIAAFAAIPALFIGLFLGGFGMMLGYIVGVASPDPAEGGGSPGPISTPAPGPLAAGGRNILIIPTASPPKPKGRHILVRMFFIVLWPIVFFFGAAIALGVVSAFGVKSEETPPAVVAAQTVGLGGSPLAQGPLLTASSLIPEETKDAQLKHQAAASMGETAAPWLLLGTLAVFVLGCVGLLPYTGRGRKKLPDAAATARPGRAGPVSQAKPPVNHLPAGLAFQDDVAPPAPEPQRRSILVRVAFVLLWPVVFFFAAAFAMAALGGAYSAGGQEAQQKAFEHSAQQHIGWIMLVSLGLFIVGCLGFLPLTGRNKWRRAAAPPAPITPSLVPEPVRKAPPRPPAAWPSGSHWRPRNS